MPEDDVMKDKFCLVTGGTRGIGFYTALGLARKGAHVILVGHNREHGESAIRRITSEVGKEAGVFLMADLSIQVAIRDLADRVHSRYQRLDVLINNVAGFFPTRKENKNGLEMTFALNHLSYYSITGHLLPLMRQGTSARIINVSSDAHRQGEIDFDDLQMETHYRGFQAYARSKLANLLFTFALDRRLQDSGITVNALHPGFVNSKLYRRTGIFEPLVKLFAAIAGKHPREGAETPIYLACSSEVNDVHGKYFVENEQTRPSPKALDMEAAEKLWKISEELTDLSYPFVN